jgi:hypothetical protein
MRYLMLIHPDGTPTPESDDWRDIPREERAAMYDGYRAINEAPGVTPGHRLHPPDTARTVRVQEGQVLVTDGPFVSAKEALGGYLLFEAESLEEAIELASRIPTARWGGAVEIRPTTGE